MIIPVSTLGVLLIMGIVAVAVIHSPSSGRGSQVPVARVTTPPPAKPVPRPGSSQQLPYYYYRVRSGDSWWSIAARECHSGAASVTLANRNHMSLYAALPVGRMIIIRC